MKRNRRRGLARLSADDTIISSLDCVGLAMGALLFLLYPFVDRFTNWIF
ncbi:MAG: hypothetical protein KY459_12285 [Acidobacteria bacterium]|nr:hypothetical protein [Acidobacteriota bacterium]